MVAASVGDQSHVDTILSQLEGQVGPETEGDLRAFATEGLTPMIEAAIMRWNEDRAEHERRRERLNRTIKSYDAKDHLSGDDEDGTSRPGGCARTAATAHPR